MIEAVNTSPAQVTTLKAAPQSVAASAPQISAGGPPPYLNTRIVIDNIQNIAILQFRNGETGEVESQYPTKVQIAAIARAAQLEKIAETQAVHQPQPTEHVAAPAQTTTTAQSPQPTQGEPAPQTTSAQAESTPAPQPETPAPAPAPSTYTASGDTSTPSAPAHSIVV